MHGPVAVLGVTGRVGRRLAGRLARSGQEVRGVARHPEAPPPPPGVRPLAADLGRPEEAHAALRGARAVFLALPQSGEDLLGRERKVAEHVIAAAREQGIAHVVLQSALHADRGNTGARLLDNKTPVEVALRESGVPHTILRPGWLLQNLAPLRGAWARGELPLPFPPARRIGVVGAGDVAEAAALLLAAGPQRRGFDLHLPGGADPALLAGALGRAAGRAVAAREVPGPALQFLEQYPDGATPPDLLAEFLEYLRGRDYLGAPDTLAQVLPGFRYTPVEEVARAELVA